METWTSSAFLVELAGWISVTLIVVLMAVGLFCPLHRGAPGGHQSVRERKIEDIPVVDSVAWARVNEQGQVVGEWVYWPAIPAEVITDARRLKERLSRDSTKGAFLARLPIDVLTGQVVIRHSSAIATGPFEAFASYDVVERRLAPEPATHERSVDTSRAASVVRHFDVDGNERSLPHERRSLDADYSGTQRPAHEALAAR